MLPGCWRTSPRKPDIAGFTGVDPHLLGAMPGEPSCVVRDCDVRPVAGQSVHETEQVQTLGNVYTDRFVHENMLAGRQR